MHEYSHEAMADRNGMPPSSQQQSQGHQLPIDVHSWELVESRIPNEGEIATRETLFSVGNGYVGVRGYHDPLDRHGGGADSISGCSVPLRASSMHFRSSVFESTLSQNPVAGPSGSHRGTYINGVYDEHMTTNVTSAFSMGSCKRECFLVAVPDAADVDITVDDEPVQPLRQPQRVSNYSRVLDLKTGELRRKFIWRTSSDVELQITERRLVSATRKNIAAMQISVTCAPQRDNPTSVDVRLISRTGLPMVDSAATSWEMESAPVASARVEDVSSVFCARTRGSKKHVTLAVNDRCGVLTQGPTETPDVLMAETPKFGSSVAAAPTFGSSLPFLGPGPTSSVLGLGSPQPNEFLGGGGGVSRSVPHGSAIVLSALNAATYLTPTCSTPMRPLKTNPLNVTPNQDDDAEIPTSIEMCFRASLLCNEVGSTLTFSKTMAYVTDADCEVEDMEMFANDAVEGAVDIRYEGLLAEQRDHMERFWATSDVQITSANPRVQGTLRFNLLQLYMSTGKWRGTGVGPRGLTGEVFNGLQSWDAEIFVFPFFLHAHPHIARSLLQFRVDTLPQAQRRALDFELPRGAIYPSRTINGSENAPSLPCALHLHVNADIAYAIKQYFEATNDMDFLVAGGIEVVWSTAVIWLEWGAWERGSFHIRSVTGPDEYNVLVHDNFYTNLMAQHHMEFAVDVYERLKAHPQASLDTERLMMSASITDEDFRTMRRAANAMALPYDPHHRIHLQDAGFLRKRSWDKVPRKENVQTPPLRSHLSPASSEAALDTLVSKRTPRPNLPEYVDPAAVPQKTAAPNNSKYGTPLPPPTLHERAATTAPSSSSPSPQYMAGGVEAAPMVMIQEYHPVVVFRHRICKNADVVLSAVLLRDKFTRDEKEANFRFYERLTAHDSSLTPPLFCIAAADLQLREEAMEYFNYTLYIDMHNVLRNTSGGLHLSCLAGSWWCVVAGFAGFCVLDGVAHFNPWMPDGWDEYKFHVRHMGALIHVVVSRRAVTYALVEGAKLLIVHAQTARVHLAKNRSVSIKLVRDVRSFDFDAVVFDVDSIIDSVEDDQFHAWSKTLDPLFVAKEGAENFKPFNTEMYLAYLRHHPISQNKRHQGLQKLLSKRGIELPVGDPLDPASDATLYGLIARKLQNFRAIVKARGVRPRAGTIKLMSDLRENGVVVGVVSASKNGHWMMQQVPAVLNLVDCFIDANQGEIGKLHWRPELDFFDYCVKRMDVTSARTVLFADGIDGFSKKSLMQYWLVVNTSLEEGLANEMDHVEESPMGFNSFNGGGIAGAMGVQEDVVPQLHIRDLTTLSTEVLHERGAFIPTRNQTTGSGSSYPHTIAGGGQGGPTSSPPLKGNTSFFALPPTSSMSSVPT